VNAHAGTRAHLAAQYRGISTTGALISTVIILYCCSYGKPVCG